jgi:hypothetical protein
MPEKRTFQCQDCKKIKEALTTDKTPECCGLPMQALPLDQCTLSSTAEHSRFDDEDEPCDDGRSGS